MAAVTATVSQGSIEVGTSAASSEPFGDGYRITLQSENIRVELLSLGASLNSVQIRNPNAAVGSPQEWIEVCHGYTTAEEAHAPGATIGPTCGRFAGRIGHGEFSLKGSHYKLPQNCGVHNLHGGPMGFDRQKWKFLLSEGEDEASVAFHLASPHLDQGFPGELFVTATYSIVKSATAPALKYVLQASLADTTPVDMTVVNLTNHAYWNLNGVPRPATPNAAAPLPESIQNHYLQLHARYFATTDETLLPNGEMTPVDGTPHDYSRLRPMAEGIEETKQSGREHGGYDDPIALETWDSTLREAVLLYSPKTKLRMRVCTTNPAVVVYTANGLPGDADGTKGKRFQRQSAICLETQYFPNSPNIPSFPSTALQKGETYSETTTHEFQFLTADVAHSTKNEGHNEEKS